MNRISVLEVSASALGLRHFERFVPEAQPKKRYAVEKLPMNRLTSLTTTLYDTYDAEAGCQAKVKGRYGQGSGWHSGGHKDVLVLGRKFGLSCSPSPAHFLP